MAFRQVHLDFHTSEAIGRIGFKFSKEQFQKALKLGHVNSVTVFSKCHHGWAYYPSKVNEMHPGLDFDLLGAMIDAAHEIGVKTPVYISAGLDEKMARRHPEWLIRDKDEKTKWAPDFMTPGYHQFCFSSPYLDYLLAQIKEVIENYDVDGLFLDIAGESVCYCQNCINTLLREGKDPRETRAVIELGKKIYAVYANKVWKLVQSIKPGLRIFHNSGHITRGRRDLVALNTHLELESLPTGGWGYDHFPLSVRYVQNLGVEYLGMTGRFHTSWGEFGGFKHPNALRYETALCIANGARCSIGDQLHPDGRMDEATYALISAAYGEVEKKEAWCTDACNIADVALLSLEAVKSYRGEERDANVAAIDSGAVRILLEGKILFDVIDIEEIFERYKVIILPDEVRIDSYLKQKFEQYLQQGGKILATGESGLCVNGNEFEIDLGVRWIGPNPYKPDYFRPNFKLKSFDYTSFVFYSQGQKVELNGGLVLGNREDPYFNRDIFNFCSHQHAPNSNKYGGPGMVENQNGIYFAWKVFEDYATKGSLALKESVLYALERLLGEPTLETNLPAQGIVTLTEQRKQKRFINHLLYASPVKRGNGIEVIEDIIPIYNIEVKIRIPYMAKKVYLAPQMQELDFLQQGGFIRYIVPKLECHQMVVIDY
ncbi:MAG: alpha-amylase family protein [Bacillota bacterium]